MESCIYKVFGNKGYLLKPYLKTMLCNVTWTESPREHVDPGWAKYSKLRQNSGNLVPTFPPSSHPSRKKAEWNQHSTLQIASIHWVPQIASIHWLKYHNIAFQQGFEIDMVSSIPSRSSYLNLLCAFSDSITSFLGCRLLWHFSFYFRWKLRNRETWAIWNNSSSTVAFSFWTKGNRYYLPNSGL